MLRQAFAVAPLSLYCSSAAFVSLITYEISTWGRIQAGSVVLMVVQLRLTVSSTDQDAAPTFGAYVGTSPFFVRLDGQSATIVGDSGVDVRESGHRPERKRTIGRSEPWSDHIFECQP